MGTAVAVTVCVLDAATVATGTAGVTVIGAAAAIVVGVLLLVVEEPADTTDAPNLVLNCFVKNSQVCVSKLVNAMQSVLCRSLLAFS